MTWTKGPAAGAAYLVVAAALAAGIAASCAHELGPS